VTKAPKNIAISVRDRLTHRARERRESSQLQMTRYVIERLLYRLGRSPHREHFVLKGAMPFSLWSPNPTGRLAISICLALATTPPRGSSRYSPKSSPSTLRTMVSSSALRRCALRPRVKRISTAASA